MDSRERNQMKSRKKKSSRSPNLLKADVILITKDVMVPVKVASPRRKLLHNLQKRVDSNLKSAQTEVICSKTVELSNSEKVNELVINLENEVKQEPIPTSTYYVPKTNEALNCLNVYDTAAVTFQKESMNYNNFDKGDKISIESSKYMTERKKTPVNSSSLNSICSLTTSPETPSIHSSQSFNVIEDSLTKFDIEFNLSSESEYEFSSNNCDNVVEDNIIFPNISINQSNLENIHKEIIEPNLEVQLSETSTDSFEEKQIIMDVENLLEKLLQDVDNCEANIIIEEIIGEKKMLNSEKNLFNKSEYNFEETTQKIVEFKYSLRDLVANNLNLTSRHSSEEFSLLKSEISTASEEKRSEIVDNNSDINLKQSDNQIEVKYSWQIMTSPDQRLESRVALHIETNSKLTDTEDLSLNKLEFQYSWQKLTAKYLAKSCVGDSLIETYPSTENITKISIHADDSVLKKNSVHDNLITNLRRQEENKDAEVIERSVDNYPLNNIISSMLPEIKLFNRRTSFNNNNLLSEFNNSSVSSIKHVLANLNAMVTTQRHILDTFDKRCKSNESSNHTEPFEKVEIFPSTLHVLGNYIVRDICPGNMNDQRSSLDPNNDVPLQDNSLAPENSKLDENVADSDLLTDTPSKLRVESKETDFLNMLSDLSTQMNNSKKVETLRSEFYETRSSMTFPIPGTDLPARNTWNPAIAGMEEIMELSFDAARCMDEAKDDCNTAVPHTKNTGPLKPRVEVTFSETKEAGDSKSRRDELLTRLDSAMSRLKQCEQHVDANWNLDYSILDIEESISDKEIPLPKQVEEHIKDIIKSAEEYLAKLEEQLNDLRNADDQIINSSERTFKDIDEAYQLFMDNLCKEINKRRNLVRLETEVFKYEGLAPLRACKQEVDAQIRSTQHLIVLTENMLTRPITFNKERLGKIINATSHMGRIPAVPMPEELPYVTFSPPNEELQKEIMDRISCVGCVLRMGPAQFTEVSERPGGLQLRWHLVDPEFASEEQTFIVQKAVGEIKEPNSSAFHTIYVGQETSCFVRDLAVDQLITLRVGIQVSDTAWSVHQFAKTSIPAYSWNLDNADYLITNSGRIATKVTQNLSTLSSRGAQFNVNHVIEFKFLEASAGTDDEGIGLAFEPGDIDDTLIRNGAILITPNGSIFMNGEKKLMKLPKIELGTKIIFTSEPKDEDTLRMNIESGNKAVTYDWVVPRPLHFVARFTESNKWNLMVK